MNLLSLVPAEVRSAYELMTQEFAPLELAQRLEPVLTQLSTIQVGARGMGFGRRFAQLSWEPGFPLFGRLRCPAQAAPAVPA